MMSHGQLTPKRQQLGLTDSLIFYLHCIEKLRPRKPAAAANKTLAAAAAAALHTYMESKRLEKRSIVHRGGRKKHCPRNRYLRAYAICVNLEYVLAHIFSCSFYGIQNRSPTVCKQFHITRSKHRTDRRTY